MFGSTPISFITSGVLGEYVLEKDGNCMTEHDGVGDLHHRALEVQGEEHALVFASSICSSKKPAERCGVHDRRVNDLSGLKGSLFLEDSGLPVLLDVLNPDGPASGTVEDFSEP